YDISSYMTAGTHEIFIRVANVGYKTGGGHMTSPDTQTNRLGIVGKMNIEIYPKSYISDVRVIASADGSLSVRGTVSGADTAVVTATVTAPGGIRVLKANLIADGDT
ncbi:beta-galactosidase, partial [[Eubacterium] siraeum]|nr:beta-galactosidase [[Eubacterium] siraeum]